jgi:hypothetical protein
MNFFQDFKKKAEEMNPLMFEDGEISDFGAEEDKSSIAFKPVRYDEEVETQSFKQESHKDTITKKTNVNVFVADCGHRVAAEPGDENLPYIAGRCRNYHMVCSNCLKTCPLCQEQICPEEYGFIVDGVVYCNRHRWRFWLGRVLFFIFNLFFEVDYGKDTEPPA